MNILSLYAIDEKYDKTSMSIIKAVGFDVLTFDSTCPFFTAFNYTNRLTKQQIMCFRLLLYARI